MATGIPETMLLQARDAIDQQQLYQMLLDASGQDPDEQTIQALQEAVAEELVADVVAASNYARRRGRAPTADDIAEAAARNRAGDCDCEGGSDPTKPLFAFWEGD